MTLRDGLSTGSIPPQSERVARCHVCGAPAIAEASDIGSARCGDCAEVRNHVVSMRTGPGGSAVAVCTCGWRSESHGSQRMTLRETKVRLHWRTMIRAVREQGVPVLLGVFAWAAMIAATGLWTGEL